MKLTAHRGVKSLAPENTLSAVKKAAELGIEWIEVDVQCTAEGVAVVFHDRVLGRCTDGSGVLSETHWEQLARLDAGSWFGEEYVGERVPAFEQLLTHARQLGLAVNVEIKCYRETDVEALCAEIIAVVERVGLPESHLLVSSFSREALAYCMEHIPSVRRGILYETLPENWEEDLRLQPYSIHCNHETLTKAQAAEVKARGLELQCFTVNSPARTLQLESWGVDRIITDCPQMLAPVQESSLTA
ncbi:glycerophosphoryl diester phosphodiesterase [Parasalinivibrio latis]|uniref:glycerophosphoryl diester phosphodiesterase n=1 Tax=Parasalinivibrio latis TaxID=2952610 RepID=UPI0030E0260F